MHKETFEKGRIINFSDAVFSIAMTLLVLEITVPSIGKLKALNDLIPNFIGFFVSFMVIALYWVSHLKLTRFVTAFTNKLLWLNILLLMFVVLLPFSTSFFVRYYLSAGPFIFYSFNLVMIGIFNFLMIYNVSRNSSAERALDSKIHLQWLKWRSLNAVFVWLIAGILALAFPLLARIFFIFIFVLQFFIDRRFKKKFAILP